MPKGKGFSHYRRRPAARLARHNLFFVHPKTTDAAALGYLIEVVQESKK